MEVTVAVTGQDSEDEPRSLRSWLAGDDDLAGLVTPVPDAPDQSGDPAGSGRSSDVVTVRLDPPGAATALANSLVAWIRNHSRDTVYQVTRPDGVSVRVSARRVRQTGGAMVRELVTELCRSVDPADLGSVH